MRPVPPRLLRDRVRGTRAHLSTLAYAPIARMLLHMRTTMILPDDLYTQVKVVAAEQQRTMTSFVEDALRAALSRTQSMPSVDYHLPEAVGVGGVLPGVDLYDSASLADLMEA